jgi:hypothetical protein
MVVMAVENWANTWMPVEGMSATIFNYAASFSLLKDVRYDVDAAGNM